MHRNSRAGRSQRGNILFLILLAVVLFAALSYAVTQSMRGGGKDGGDERFSVEISRLLNHFAAIDLAVMRMRLTGGYNIDQISFDNNVWLKDGSPTTQNPIHGDSIKPDISAGTFADCSSPQCEIFNVLGGGVSVYTVPEYFTNSRDSGFHAGSGFTTGTLNLIGTGTNSPDPLIGFIGVTREFCMAFNEAVGVENDGDCPPQEWPWDGIGNNNSSTRGKETICLTNISSVSGACDDDQQFWIYHFIEVN